LRLTPRLSKVGSYSSSVSSSLALFGKEQFRALFRRGDFRRIGAAGGGRVDGVTVVVFLAAGSFTRARSFLQNPFQKNVPHAKSNFLAGSVEK